MRIAAITPTRGDRPKLLDNCITQMQNQTVKLDKHYIIDYPPLSNEVDLIERVKYGIELAKKDGIDFVFIIEDDDYYPTDFIEKTYKEGYDIIGYEKTIYYHIGIKGKKEMIHPFRSSLFCTAFKINALDLFKYPKPTEPYLDLKIWTFAVQKLKYYLHKEVLAIGIKHGVGICGGRGHLPSSMNYEVDESFFINQLPFYNPKKTIVAVIVYDRIDNIKRWLRCWNLCNQKNTELIIIHNCEFNTPTIYDENVKVIRRKNIGMDIGAFQDVCKERLLDFPNDWDNLIWITDDVIPMDKNFVSQFTDKIVGNVGVSCIEISKEVRPHIRTTGFCISKSASKKITFLVEKITTKEDCYRFEHRHINCFFNQLQTLNIRVAQLTENVANAPLWDMNERKHFNRMNEHLSIFPTSEKIVFISPIFNSFPEIISSLICQTYPNWELRLIHDGKSDFDLIERLVNTINDKRITYIQTPQRVGNWGHSIRHDELELLKKRNDVDYVVITNADNFHVPTFCEYMVNAFKSSPNSVGVYCSDMVHSYKKWGVINCSMKLGFVDCAGVMLRKDVACEIGWRDVLSHSSDWTYFDDVIKKYGVEKFTKVAGALLIHN